MKVPRSLVGASVILTWRDPVNNRSISHSKNKSDVPKGLEALAEWKEWGMIDDLTEGVVRIVHSAAVERHDKESPDEYLHSWVPESLIERIEVLSITSVYPPLDQAGPIGFQPPA